jgi:diacylglycerol O-acyltransferase
MYPVSIPFDGGAVNFTVVSNFENLDFGIVACRKSVPHVQRLIDYMEESLVELEDAAGLRTPSGRRRAQPRRKAKSTPGAPPRSQAKAKAKATTKSRPKAKAEARAKAKTKSSRN